MAGADEGDPHGCPSEGRLRKTPLSITRRGPLSPREEEGSWVKTAEDRPASRRDRAVSITGRRIAPLIENAMLAQQPGVDDLPLVPSPRLEVQQLGSLILKIEIEFERVAAGRRPGDDRLAGQPAIPFSDDQVSQILLLHFLRAQNKLEPEKRARVVALVLRCKLRS
jgi:hypothetical protein